MIADSSVSGRHPGIGLLFLLPSLVSRDRWSGHPALQGAASFLLKEELLRL